MQERSRCGLRKIASELLLWLIILLFGLLLAAAVGILIWYAYYRPNYHISLGQFLQWLWGHH